MKRVGLVVAYDGTHYSGWQTQPNGMTIQGVLNDTLSELLGEKIETIGASRTDAGVHALGNVAVFDTESRIPGEKFSYALNQRLPEDIRIRFRKQSKELMHMVDLLTFNGRTIVMFVVVLVGEVVTRMLKYFASEGLVEVSRGGVKILDKKRLWELAL